MNKIESIYWVFTLKCNDFCGHCYNNSGPNGESVSTEELLEVISNFPNDVGRIILSGGEPLVEMDKLLRIVRALRSRYKNTIQIYLQTNGDLLDKKKLSILEEADIDRIDIVSVDDFHRLKGTHVPKLRELFLSHEWQEHADSNKNKKKIFSFWGADENFWVGGLWARGRALINNYGNKDPKKNFCAQWSGALGFLDFNTLNQEVHVQLYRVYPCCPTTLYSLGDLRHESLNNLLLKIKNEETYRLLNKGNIYSLGINEGLSPEYIESRIKGLGDVCLWCDEFFDKHYKGAKGERRREKL